MTRAEGETLGTIKLLDVLHPVEEKNVDPAETAPTMRPPVCHPVDYGKFKYQEQRKAHDAKLKQRVIQVKETKFRPGTDDSNHGAKLRNATRFSEDGDRVRVILRFRGREMAHQEFSMCVLERIKLDLKEFGQVEQILGMEDRQIVMILTPRRKK